MPDARFEQFYRDTADLTWSSADEIGRRGRRRRRRQRFAVGTATAAAMAGLVVAGVAVRGGADSEPRPILPASRPTAPVTSPFTATPSVSPSAPPPDTATAPPTASGHAAPETTASATSPSPTALTEVPAAAMLRAGDVGSGSWQVTDEANGDWTVYFTLGLCADAVARPDVDDIDTRERTISQGDAQVLQRVRAFPSSRARAALAGLRAEVQDCGTFQPRFGGEQITVRILRDGFATADESFIVEVRSANGVGLHAFVRHGSLITEVVTEPDTETDALRVGRAAADRLRSA
jgi:hypothetical protein